MRSQQNARPRREVVEHTIQRLLDAAERLMWELDDSDGDADEEPAYGSLATMPSHDQRHWAQGNTDEREDVCEDEGAQDDREPDPGEDVILYHPNDQRRAEAAIVRGKIVYAEAEVR